MIATALALASTGLVAFAAGVLVGRIGAAGEPPLREAPRPAEACVARKPWIVPWTDIEATWDGDEP